MEGEWDEIRCRAMIKGVVDETNLVWVDEWRIFFFRVSRDHSITDKPRVAYQGNRLQTRK